MNMDEANPVKGNKSANRQKEKKFRECIAYPLIPSLPKPRAGTVPSVASELCPLVWAIADRGEEPGPRS